MPVGGFLLNRLSSLEAQYQRPLSEGSHSEEPILSLPSLPVPTEMFSTKPTLALPAAELRGSAIKWPGGRSRHPWRGLPSSHPPPVCVLVFRTLLELFPFRSSPPTAVAEASLQLSQPSNFQPKGISFRDNASTAPT